MNTISKVTKTLNNVPTARTANYDKLENSLL